MQDPQCPLPAEPRRAICGSDPLIGRTCLGSAALPREARRASEGKQRLCTETGHWAERPLTPETPSLCLPPLGGGTTTRTERSAAQSEEPLHSKLASFKVLKSPLWNSETLLREITDIKINVHGDTIFEVYHPEQKKMSIKISPSY